LSEIASLASLVNDDSSSDTPSNSFKMCFKSGQMADTIMHFSAERASVNTLSGSKTEASTSKVEKS